ncbi:MAG TPA: alpha/beta hydrolase [Candidatus Binataceae bacterium]|nr:alpha/beta hydrolase [Candidatus Binataceae bacterium]
MQTSHPALRSLLREGRVLNEWLAFTRAAGASITSNRTESPQTILLIPGFMAGDVSLYPLAHRLRGEGHKVRFAGITANVACSRKQMARLESVVQETAREAGIPVVVVGHSLGGIYARALARRLPDLIAHTFLLGSPIRGPLHTTNPIVKMLFIATRRTHDDGTTCIGELSSLCGIHLQDPPRVPSTLIYSKSDGVVQWPACIEFAAHVEAVEVKSTHCGIPYNLDTLRIISDRVRAIGQAKAAQADSANGASSNGGPSVILTDHVAQGH